MNTPFMNVHVQFTESDNVNMAVHQRPCCVYTTHARAHTLRSKPKACFARSPHTPTLKLLILHVLLINLLELRATLGVVCAERAVHSPVPFTVPTTSLLVCTLCA